MCSTPILYSHPNWTKRNEKILMNAPEKSISVLKSSYDIFLALVKTYCARPIQESVKNACGNNQYYADNHLGDCSKRQYYWMRNKEQYLNTLSKGHRFRVGLLANVHYTVQIHPCWELLVDWVSNGQADKRGGRYPGWRGSGSCSTWAKQGKSL